MGFWDRIGRGIGREAEAIFDPISKGIKGDWKGALAGVGHDVKRAAQVKSALGPGEPGGPAEFDPNLFDSETWRNPDDKENPYREKLPLWGEKETSRNELFGVGLGRLAAAGGAIEGAFKEPTTFGEPDPTGGKKHRAFNALLGATTGYYGELGAKHLGNIGRKVKDKVTDKLNEWDPHGTANPFDMHAPLGRGWKGTHAGRREDDQGNQIPTWRLEGETEEQFRDRWGRYGLDKAARDQDVGLSEQVRAATAPVRLEGETDEAFNSRVADADFLSARRLGLGAMWNNNTPWRTDEDTITPVGPRLPGRRGEAGLGEGGFRQVISRSQPFPDSPIRQEAARLSSETLLADQRSIRVPNREGTANMVFGGYGGAETGVGSPALDYQMARDAPRPIPEDVIDPSSYMIAPDAPGLPSPDHPFQLDPYGNRVPAFTGFSGPRNIPDQLPQSIQENMNAQDAVPAASRFGAPGAQDAVPAASRFGAPGELRPRQQMQHINMPYTPTPANIATPARVQNIGRNIDRATAGFDPTGALQPPGYDRASLELALGPTGKRGQATAFSGPLDIGGGGGDPNKPWWSKGLDYLGEHPDVAVNALGQLMGGSETNDYYRRMADVRERESEYEMDRERLREQFLLRGSTSRWA